MHRVFAAAVFGAAAVGCAHMSLKAEAVSEIRVEPQDESLCPGQETKVAVTAVLSDGREVATTGAGHGRVGWSNYTTTFTGGTGKDGKIRLSTDPRVTWSEPARLTVAAVDHPDVQWTGEIGVRYDCDVRADFGGDSGLSGATGSGGSDGDSPGARGDDGRDGSEGHDGEDGQGVDVWVTTVAAPGRPTLVQAAVEGSRGRTYCAFDPERGALTVVTGGGAGGEGGAGGSGGRGGHAEKDTRQGRGGRGGNGACGGHGGDAGSVVLHVDPGARPLLDRIRILSEGGPGGDGGHGGSGGKGSPDGRDGRVGCDGLSGSNGDLRTVEEAVTPLW